MPTRPPKYISLATKNAIVYFIMALAGMVTLGFLLFQNSAKEIVRSSEQQVAHASELVEVKFAAFLNNILRDINYLAQSPYLNDYLQNLQHGQSDKKELLAPNYLALLNSKPDYSQIRLIGIENNGKEIIRAERMNDSTFFVQSGSLQEKGNRDYFTETIRLPKGAVFFSPIDLNKEYGQITAPAVPTLRAACPVFLDKKPYGIIVINVDLRHFFKELTTLVSTNFDLKIVNMDGHFLIHPDPSKTFTFEYGLPPLFEEDFGIPVHRAVAISRQQHSQVIRENGLLYAFRPIAYPREGYGLFLGVGSDEKALLQSFFAWRKKSLAITAGLALLILFLAFWYMRRQAKELKSITQTMTAFPGNMVPAKLPISRRDEIGQLAQSFEQMSAIITANLTALKKANAEVEQAIRDKDAFLENMSHEIRNPIHSIMGMTYMLEKNNPGRHQQAFIEALKFNSKNLLSLVNDILDYKKLSTGEISIHPEWFLLPPLIEEIANSQRFSAVAKRVKLNVEIDHDLDRQFVFSDPHRLTQVINNLVINAIKFTDENGEVSIEVGILEKNEDGLRVRFSVRDNGIGISKDQLTKITERNYSIKNERHRGVPEGAGLGLPIIIHLLEIFSSKLHIDSTPGQGSHFYFDLFAQTKPHHGAETNAAPSIPGGLLQTMDVLVMDDDDQILFLYEHLFEKCANSVTKVSSPNDLSTLPERAYHIIISDVHFGIKETAHMTGELVKRFAPYCLFYIVSGITPSSGSINQFPNAKRVFQKPINMENLLMHITCDVAELYFGLPDTSGFLTDYDHDTIKYQRAIGLLIEEWGKMSGQIEAAILNHDPDRYYALHHKLITSVRRLHLARFEEVLDQPFSKEETPVSLAMFAGKIKQMMGFYIWYLRQNH